MDESLSQIEYNQDLAELESILSHVQRRGDFFFHGTAEIPMPKIAVKDVGILSFPVPDAQIDALIRHATRAPYGRGEQTILDESVRKVWQVPLESIEIGGKSWSQNFDRIVEEIRVGLGCEDVPVSAELYKMLVYDCGSFFLAHRDTEKSPGMFGTLVLVLPSPHSGGELIIRHAGRETAVDLSHGEFSEVTYAAFYADCEHEVRPVTGGHRICLVYNLIAAPRGKSSARAIQAPDYQEQIRAIARLLESKLNQPDACTKFAWLLDHQYTTESLSFTSLKAADSARAQVLIQAAESAGCAVHLGIVHIEESGIAEENYHGYCGGRHSYYYDDEDGGDRGADFEVIEVCDQHQYISDWRDSADRPLDLGQIPLHPGELLPAGALDDEEPDDQKCMEASGNEGASFERSYLRAALVVWRREQHVDVLLQGGAPAAVGYLKTCVEAVEAPGATSKASRQAVKVARRIVTAWQPSPDSSSGDLETRKRTEMLDLLARLSDPAVTATFIRKVIIPMYDGAENTALRTALSTLAPTEAGDLVSELFQAHMAALHVPCIRFLHTLVEDHVPPPKPKDRSVLTRMAQALVDRLDEAGTIRKKPQFWEYMPAPKAPAMDAASLHQLLRALRTVGDLNLARDAMLRVVARPSFFDPVQIVVPALKLMKERDEIVRTLWTHSAEFILQRNEHPPVAPRDWTQQAVISCKCPDCRELQAFLRDPKSNVHLFRVRKDRRSHLHQIIESNGLDLTHVTERTGSPQTLVCTKTRASYKRWCTAYLQDMAALRSLDEMGAECKATKTLRDRIVTTLDRASAWQMPA